MSNSYVNIFTDSPVVPADVSYQKFEMNSTLSSIQLSWSSSFKENNGYPFADIMKVTNDDSASTYTITMPPADRVSVGTSCIIYNSGIEPLQINDYAGNKIQTIKTPSGFPDDNPNVYYFYVDDNTTPGGKWVTFGFGAGTCAAQTSSLAGYGLTTIGASETLNTNTPIMSMNDNFYIDFTMRGATISWNGGAVSYLLPIPMSNTFQNGYYVNIINYNSSGPIVLSAPSNVKINGDNSFRIPTKSSATLLTDGSNWYTLGFSQTVSIGQSPTFPVGTSVSPSISFVGEPASGIYCTAPGVGISSGGSSVATFKNDIIQFSRDVSANNIIAENITVNGEVLIQRFNASIYISTPLLTATRIQDVSSFSTTSDGSVTTSTINSTSTYQLNGIYWPAILRSYGF